MTKVQTLFWAVFLVSVLLADFAVQARFCWPPCEDNERCMPFNPRERRTRRNNVCVPKRCLFRPRRGRCRSFRHPYHFHPITMRCVRDISGACYGRRNRFTTMEDCELTCLTWYGR